MSSSPRASLFEVAGTTPDVAQQALEFMLRGASDLFGASGSAPHQAALTLLSYLNGALLVFGVLVVVYHLIVMVSESAHYGVPFGKRNKQLWAPVRLVLALGLLVPVGGFGTAQYLVMQAARMGSGLASNGWQSFAETLKPQSPTYHASARIDPTSTIAHLVAIGLCVKSYEIVYAGLPPEQVLAPVSSSSFLILKNETSKIYSRILYQAKVADGKGLPAMCGQLSWLEPDPQGATPTLVQLSTRFSRAHLAAIKEIQADALNLGGSLALGSLGIYNGQDDSYTVRFAKLTQAYRGVFRIVLEQEKIAVTAKGDATLVATETVSPPVSYGWLLAGTSLQRFVLSDTAVLTPELAAPVVNFQYPLYAAFNDKPTQQLARGLSFARLFLQNFDPAAASALWFNPALDHGKGPVKQAFTLTASILARQDGTQDAGSLLDFGAEPTGRVGFYQPIALGFRALDLADQFWAVAEWSPRVNSSVFGPAGIFGNLAQAVQAALLAAVPKPEVGQPTLATPAAALAANDLDRPSDLARLLLGLLGALIFIPAILLLFLLPLLPLLHFALGGVIWLIAVFQGVLAAPLWALTFLSLRGDDVVPPGARLGLTLILNIFLRPILIVAGFIAALLLMQAGFGILDVSLRLFSYDGLQNNPALYSLGTLVLLIVKLLATIAIANTSLHCISLFPEFTLRWMGSAAGGASGGGDDAGAAAPGAAVAAGGGSGGSGGNGTASASVAASVSAMHSSQQQWQRKLLSVLDIIAGQQRGSSAPTQNAHLFAHMADRPDQPPVMASASSSANTISATAANVGAAAGTTANSASITDMMAEPAARAPLRAAELQSDESGEQSLMAKVIPPVPDETPEK